VVKRFQGGPCLRGESFTIENKSFTKSKEKHTVSNQMRKEESEHRTLSRRGVRQESLFWLLK